ncbi:MAG: glycoside hydrolase family 38 C-terminal domain-containing protein [Clostridia bacterium]|nr:glycoside hydrolase family 38 C-terminal domain-containing protein [Clostridia bacterium]
MADICLLCNAHIDPVWQWDREEGIAVTLSTFRAAASFCEETDGFVFNHNEAMLYRWVEEYDPLLFSRIRKLVQAGKWHIMGGWYLQPDCDLPSGESFFRQITLGREYFREKFGVTCTTAVSMDAFGHDRGLVQLLKQAGYDSYLFMRPSGDVFPFPGDAFRWRGYDGSEIMAWHIDCGYHSDPGLARKKIEKWLAAHPDIQPALIPWGVGNHGGGPSRTDIRDIDCMITEHPEHSIVHATPETFFSLLSREYDKLPVVSSSLRPFAVGCYTSQTRVKQRHRELEAMLDLTTRIAADAALQRGVVYPAGDIRAAEEDLCMIEFHDILPGSDIRDGEAFALRAADHALEILNRVRTRAFFALAAGQQAAAPGETAILVYNPWPYPVEAVISPEFMLEDAEERHGWFDVTVRSEDGILPSQVVKERSNMAWEWRKRVAFRAVLPPMRMSRFDASVTNVDRAPEIDKEAFVFDNGFMHAEIDPETGLLRSYRVCGTEYLSAPAGRLVLYRDTPDSWGMTVNGFTDAVGVFRLMTPEESALFAGTGEAAIPPVRVTEDGPVYRETEVCFIHNGSTALAVWRFPKKGKEISLELRVHLNERNIAVKLHIPTMLTGQCLGQGIFGFDALAADGTENVAQNWIAATGDDRMLTLINSGTGGSSFEHGELRQTLLRACGYAAHPRGDAPVLRPGRYSAAQEQGERDFSFRLSAGLREERLANVSREAQIFSAPPYALSCFPAGYASGGLKCLVRLAGDGIVMTRLEPDGTRPGNLMIRLHESAGKASTAILNFPCRGGRAELTLKPFEILTLTCDPMTGLYKMIPPVEG